MQDNASSFGARLKIIAADCGGLSQLARDTGINVRTLSRWANSQAEPQVTELRTIAEIANVRIDWLVNGAGQMRNDPVDRPTEKLAPIQTDHRLMGRLTDKIVRAYKEAGVSVPLHQAAERAAHEHDRIVREVADPDDRLIEIGEAMARLREELRAKANAPENSKRLA